MKKYMAIIISIVVATCFVACDDKDIDSNTESIINHMTNDVPTQSNNNGTVVVPNVVGLNKDEAVNKLEESGLKYKIIFKRLQVKENNGVDLIYYDDNSDYDKKISDVSKNGKPAVSQSSSKKQDYLGAGLKEDKELEEIFYRSLGGNRGRNADKSYERTHRAGDAVKKSIKGNAPGEDGHVEIKAAKKQYLLVDGYNIIFAWEELNELAALNIDAARAALIDILANYQGFKGMTLILVFDAYKVKGNHGSIEKYHNIYVVYTKEAQTADAYIEKTVHEIGKKERVTVATSDGLEQTIVFGEGAVRMSARELYEDVKSVQIDIRRDYTDKSSRLRNTLESYL